jgi:hypothetical protein
MRQFPFIVLLLLLFAGLGSGQSLHDVIVSLSDRQRVIQQYTQVSTHLANLTNDPEADDQPISTYTPFAWYAVGQNPSQSAVESLGLADQVKLLNQAVYQFDALKYSFLNVSDAELVNGGVVGAVKRFESSDFDVLPRATPENYHDLLRALAQNIRNLRLVTWPAAFSGKSLNVRDMVHDTVELDEQQNPFVKTVDAAGNVVTSPDWFPASISAENGEESVTDHTHVYHYAVSDISVTGSYSESDSVYESITQKLRHRSTGFSSTYFTKVRVCDKPADTSDSPLNGTVWILRRSHWHELDIVNPPADFDADQAGYVGTGS